MSTTVKILKAFHGDSILIQTQDADGVEFNILVDGGPSQAFEFTLKRELASLSVIHLLVLTHIDSDHIAGLLKLLKSSLIKKIEVREVWMNGRNVLKVASGEKITYGQGMEFEKLLISQGILDKGEHKEIYTELGPLIIGRAVKITVLSPTKEILNSLYENWPEISLHDLKDSSDVNVSATLEEENNQLSLKDLAKIPYSPQKTITADIFNSSSIAMLIETKDCALLLLSDSRPEIILEALRKYKFSSSNKLKVDLVKISHHGSKNNTSNEVLDLIDCDTFVLSTNGGDARSKHPNRETIARIIYHPERNLDKQRKIFLNHSISEVTRRKGRILLDSDLLDGNWELIEQNIFRY
jgi:beta-lactamase superfamily II metal-dependent hydrolase